MVGRHHAVAAVRRLLLAGERVPARSRQMDLGMLSVLTSSL